MTEIDLGGGWSNLKIEVVDKTLSGYIVDGSAEKILKGGKFSVSGYVHYLHALGDSTKTIQGEGYH